MKRYKKINIFSIKQLILMLALFKPGGFLVLLIRGLSSGAVSDHSVQTGPGRGRVCVV